MMVVKHVDQQDKPLCLIAPGIIEHRHILDKKRRITLGDSDIVGSAEGIGAKIIEGKPCGPRNGPRHDNVASFDMDRIRLFFRAILMCSPGRIHASGRLRPQR